MGRVKVMAFGMHEREIAAAERILGSNKDDVTDAFVLGEIDESRIPELENAGLIVERLPDRDDSSRQPETPGTGTKVIANLTLRSTAFSSHRVTVADELPNLNRPNVFLIQIDGPLLDSRRARLSALGVKLLKGYGSDFYSAYLQPMQVAQVTDLDFVSAVRLYDGQMTAPAARPEVAPAAQPTVTEGGTPILTYDVRVHRDEDVKVVQDWLKQNNIAIAGTSRRKLRIYALENSPILSSLASLPEVERFEEYVPPRLWNDRAEELLKLVSPAGEALGFDGINQLIGIADTGIDDTHPDFSGKLHRVFARGRPGLHDDPHGHGTHVAGSAAGTGQASNGAFKGAARSAKIVFQSLLDSAGGLGGLPLDLSDLFDEAYQTGVRIHNNSWGAATNATYTMSSSEVDDYVWNHPDFLIVVAAGNEGDASNPLNTPRGIVDWLSIGSPATSKNSLTVGASRSDRTSGGLSTTTWGGAWPSDFPDRPISADNISGNPECMAGFSSRGPSDDRRIKPDVVAPGTDIVSARSAKAPSRAYWALHSNPSYAYMGGTSMATPLVSGCAAIVRQYYVDGRKYVEPSAALIRATLINGARWLTGHDAIASNPQPANYDQGFGCIDMSMTIPNGQNKFALSYVDSWKIPGMALASTGNKKQWIVTLDKPGILRICLTYTDYPARGLQNNLNLMVQRPDGRKLVGNEGIRQTVKSLDVDNNVEIVRIADAVAGDYWVQVTATNLLHPPQNFALVLSGPLQREPIQA